MPEITSVPPRQAEIPAGKGGECNAIRTSAEVTELKSPFRSVPKELRDKVAICNVPFINELTDEPDILKVLMKMSDNPEYVKLMFLAKQMDPELKIVYGKSKDATCMPIIGGVGTLALHEKGKITLYCPTALLGLDDRKLAHEFAHACMNNFPNHIEQEVIAELLALQGDKNSIKREAKILLANRIQNNQKFTAEGADQYYNNTLPRIEKIIKFLNEKGLNLSFTAEDVAQGIKQAVEELYEEQTPWCERSGLKQMGQNIQNMMK